MPGAQITSFLLAFISLWFLCVKGGKNGAFFFSPLSRKVCAGEHIEWEKRKGEINGHRKIEGVEEGFESGLLWFKKNGVKKRDYCSNDLLALTNITTTLFYTHLTHHHVSPPLIRVHCYPKKRKAIFFFFCCCCREGIQYGR